MLELPKGVPHDVPGLWQEYRNWLALKGVRHPRVVIHGGYGKNNLGDDTILHVLITRTLEHFAEAHITVVCHGPEVVARRYRDLSNFTACGFKSAETAKAILSCHIYMIGGGGIINKINTYSGRDKMRLLDMKGKFLFLAAAAAKLAGARTIFYAIGATSFPDSAVRLLARRVLEHADTVSVRDPRSIRNLEALGLKRPLVRVLDPALSMSPAPRVDGQLLLNRWGYRRSERPLIMVGFRYERSTSEEEARKVARVVALVDYLVSEHGADVVFVPASQHPSVHLEDDLDLGRRVRAGVSATEHFFLIEEYAHPAVTMAAFGCADLCVFERLHAVILTSMMEVPFYAIAYDAKVSEYVAQIGCSGTCITSSDFVASTDHQWLLSSLVGLGSRATSDARGDSAIS